LQAKSLVVSLQYRKVSHSKYRAKKEYFALAYDMRQNLS